MGKSWDSKGVSFQKETWEVIRKACLSGAPLLSFGGTRTFHRIACAIEDAGWEIRDTLMWVYGQGFPKSLDISKAIDYDYCRDALEAKFQRKPTRAELKAAWEDFREIVGTRTSAYGDATLSETEDGRNLWGKSSTIRVKLTGSAVTTAAQLWEGYGTALKPAYEPIILAMNPLDGTFANNALKHGVAGLNIDECRIDYQSEADKAEAHYNALGMERLSKDYGEKIGSFDGGWKKHHPTMPRGRFPSNFIHDGSQMVMELFPERKAGLAIEPKGKQMSRSIYGKTNTLGRECGFGDNGSAARFFYCAKASKAERNKGCEDLEPEQMDESRKEGNPGGDNPRNRGVHKVSNNHPTVKALALMEYLVRLVKMPEYNLIIDPFMGSGTTLLACIKLGIPCIGIDNDEHTCEIAARRCSQEVMEFSSV